jgi:hypothetical protein
MLLVGNQVLFGNFSANPFTLNPQGLTFITHPLRLEPCLIWDSNPEPLGFKLAMLPLEPLRSALVKFSIPCQKCVIVAENLDFLYLILIQTAKKQ